MRLGDSIQPFASGDWGRSPRWGVLGAKLPHRNEGLWGPSPFNIKKFLHSSSPESTTKVKYKIDHNSKTKNRTKKYSCIQKLRSEYCASFEINITFWRKNDQKHLKIVNKVIDRIDYISKTMNRTKNINVRWIPIFPVNLATFEQKKFFRSLLPLFGGQ